MAFPFGAIQADSAGIALEYDGVNDYVRLPRTNTIMGGTAWAANKTVSLWLKPTGTTSPAVVPETGQLIVGNDFPRSFGLTRATYGGNDRLWVWNWDSNGVDRIAITFTQNEWVHIAVVHNSNTLSVYKNGELVGSIASGATIINGNNGDGTLFLGGSGRNGTTTYFAGQLDDVRLWNTALDQPAIVDWMTLDLTIDHPNWSNLAANYRMSNGSGTSLADDSGHGHTGTLLGGMSDVNWVLSTAYGPIVTPEPNEPPVADAQTLTTDEDTPLSITLTASDADNHPLTFSIEDQPTHGAVSGTPPDLVYTPASNFHGADSFSFVANDGFVDSESALINISVNPVNDQPIAIDDAVVTLIDSAVTVQVLVNDSDVDGDTLTVSATGLAANGVVVNNGTEVIYTPNQGYLGTDNFSYTISDGNSGTATAQVNVTVNEQEEPPPVVSAGFALAFDGTNDFVRLPETQQIFGDGWEATHSVNLWVKPTALAPTATNPAWCDAIFGDRPRWWGISHCVLNGYDRIWVWNYDGNFDLIGVGYDTDQWVNIALVQSNGQLTAYRDGVVIGSMASGPTLQPNTGAHPVLQIGAVINNASRNWSFQGEIDEVRLWTIPLTEAQIQNEMYLLLSGDEPGLAAYYQMSNGTGALLTDDSIYSWDGTLQDGLLPTVPPDGPIAWVPSGAFDPPIGTAMAAYRDETVILSIEGLPESEIEDVEQQFKLFLPATHAE